MTQEELLVDIRTDAEKSDEEWIRPYMPSGTPGKNTNQVNFAICMVNAQRARIKHYYDRMPPRAQTRAMDMLEILMNQLKQLKSIK